MDKDNKKRLMLMKAILEKYSDKEHPLTTAQIMMLLEQDYSMKMHRTTVAKDVAALIEMGIDVKIQRSTQNKYYIADRYFNLSEVKTLIDSVSETDKLSNKKRDELTAKIKNFASIYQQEKLKITGAEQ